MPNYFYAKKVALQCSSNIKWDVIISPPLRPLEKVWVWYRCQNGIGKYFHHDGQQLTFYQKELHIKTHRLRKESGFVAFVLQ